eukprot:15468752-Alexandrium_andersonii.AAC.1
MAADKLPVPEKISTPRKRASPAQPSDADMTSFTHQAGRPCSFPRRSASVAQVRTSFGPAARDDERRPVRDAHAGFLGGRSPAAHLGFAIVMALRAKGFPRLP